MSINAQLNGTHQTASQSTISQQMVRRSAEKYIEQSLGSNFQLQEPKFQYGRWTVGLLYSDGNELQPIYVGFLRTDEETGHVDELTADEIWDIKERAKYRAAKERGEIGRTDDGHILPYRARIVVNSHLGNTFTMFAGSAGRPELIEGEPDRWRVQATFKLPSHKEKTYLGTVDVDAVTGEVIPLTDTELAEMTRLAQDAAERPTLSAAAAD